MESTRSKTRAVLLKGCLRHRSERVGIKADDLRHAVGPAADEFIRRSGKTVEGKLISEFDEDGEPDGFEQLSLVFFNRKKLIRFIEAAVIPEE